MHHWCTSVKGSHHTEFGAGSRGETMHVDIDGVPVDAPLTQVFPGQDSYKNLRHFHLPTWSHVDHLPQEFSFVDGDGNLIEDETTKVAAGSSIHIRRVEG